ncbi:SseB family protein [Pseudonocardia sp. CA-142604]|uniref:SseB family protein n=1 Tax=Pseudonocardia sp. CA-142604 TaxID=3240024 RepID=UPI003D8CD240
MTSTPDDAATNDTAAGRAADTTEILRGLATTIGLLPQAPSPDGEEPPEGAISLPVIEHDGRRYVPVFTSEDALQSAGAEVGTAIRIPIVQLAANWPSDDIWLAVNPTSEDGIGLPPDLVRTLPAFAGSPGGNGQAPLD